MYTVCKGRVYLGPAGQELKIEAILMSTSGICSLGDVRKILFGYHLLSEAMYDTLLWIA